MKAQRAGARKAGTEVHVPGRTERVPPEVVAALLEMERSCDRSACRENDPVRFAHLYDRPEDQEVVALVSALLAFGRVGGFLPKIRQVLDALGKAPARSCRGLGPSPGAALLEGFTWRLYRASDIRVLLASVGAILREYGSLEEAYVAGSGAAVTARARLAAFVRLFHGGLPGARGHRERRGYRHLAADPSAGSTCKRWNLFLRWVVRPADGVDLGLWRRVRPSDLVLPLDVHVGRITALLGLRTRRTLDWKAAEDVTTRLRAVDPEDPLRFDFPMSHLGISEGCRGVWAPDACPACPIQQACPAVRRTP